MVEQPVALLGVPFDRVSAQETIARVDAMIASRQPHYIVTANVDFLVQAHRDVELRRILLEADLVLCDGTPLVWASRLLGNALPERVAGSDLAPLLLSSAAEKGHRVFFLGAAPGVAVAAAERLKREYPNLEIVGHYAPPYAALLEMDHAQIVQRIRAARPDILLVSFGCPKQEKWIAMHHRTLGVPVAIGVGATLDFLAGRVKRAPAWMRHSGTEWVYRLLQEPRRLFRRYASDLVFFAPTFLEQWSRFRAGDSSGAPQTTASVPPGWSGVDLGEALTRRTLDEFPAFWSGVLNGRSHCLVDTSRLRTIDATGIAFLIRWRRLLARQKRQLVLVAPSRRLDRVLRSLRLSDYFLVAADAADGAHQVDALVNQPPVIQDGQTRSLAWCGEIVAANSEDVWRMSTGHIQAFAGTGATLVIIDLSRLRFIDSSGASVMVRLSKWVQSLSVQILFTGAQPNVRNVLRLSRLDQLLLEGGQ